MIEEAHARDIPVAALAGTVQHAERNVTAGADIIVAQGYEAGGHTGTIAAMVLVPEVVDAVKPARRVMLELIESFADTIERLDQFAESMGES